MKRQTSSSSIKWCRQPDRVTKSLTLYVRIQMFFFTLGEFLQNTEHYQWITLVPTSSKTRNVANIRATERKHEEILRHILPLHALTGCDTVSSIYGVGNVKAVKILQTGHVPPPLGNGQIYIETIVSGATEFIAACYGSKCSGTLSQIRFNVWQSKTGHIFQAAISSTYFGSLWAPCETGTSPSTLVEGCNTFRSTCTNCCGVWVAGWPCH